MHKITTEVQKDIMKSYCLSSSVKSCSNVRDNFTGDNIFYIKGVIRREGRKEKGRFRDCMCDENKNE